MPNYRTKKNSPRCLGNTQQVAFEMEQVKYSPNKRHIHQQLLYSQGSSRRRGKAMHVQMEFKAPTLVGATLSCEKARDKTSSAYAELVDCEVSG